MPYKLPLMKWPRRVKVGRSGSLPNFARLALHRLHGLVSVDLALRHGTCASATSKRRCTSLELTCHEVRCPRYRSGTGGPVVGGSTREIRPQDRDRRAEAPGGHVRERGMHSHEDIDRQCARRPWCSGPAALPDTVTAHKIEVRKWLEQERNRESMWNRERDERFEQSLVPASEHLTPL